MTVLYKLTDRNWETRGQTKWGPGVTHGPLSGEGDLCGPGWLHAYTSLELALLMNPAHADIRDPVCWLAEGEVGKSDRGLKVGCRTLTTVRIVEPPVVTTEHRVRFAILCALEVYKEPEFVAWANAWLSGEDRSARSARAAERAAEAAEEAAAWAARAALEAERAAAWAAAWEARERAEARAAAWAAEAAARSALAAARAEEPSALNLDALAKKAIYGDAK